MRLKEGVSVSIGRKTWRGEIPDKTFDALTKKWKAEQRADFKKEFEHKAPVTAPDPAPQGTGAGKKKDK